MLRVVDFKPDSVSTRDEGSVLFPWKAKYGSLNGFGSVHGGSLSTLADIFTKIHARAAAPGHEVASISLEISFLSAIFEGKDCTCVTRIAHDAPHTLHTEFSFEDDVSGEVYARGSHAVSIE